MLDATDIASTLTYDAVIEVVSEGKGVWNPDWSPCIMALLERGGERERGREREERERGGKEE